MRINSFFFFSILALYLEQDWRDIVQNSDQLSEKQQQQQTALWELAQTEVAYIKTLKVVTDVSPFFFFCKEYIFNVYILRYRIYSTTFINTLAVYGVPLQPAGLEYPERGRQDEAIQ